MQLSTFLSFASAFVSVAAQVKGFNYGSTLTDGSAKSQAVFESEFAAAKALAGTTGFTSARLYTMIQAGTTNTPISAIPAAIAQDTTLLLGLWASAGDANIVNEIAALQAAISQYGTAFTSRVVGISVGSEDLYRTSTTGIAAKAGIGATPNDIVSYISQVRQALASTALSAAKITHVDTFNAWTNGSNAAVIAAVDFISMDAYPYFQAEMANGIVNGATLFESAYAQTVAVSGGKDVWVTETGWPVSGENQGAAVASVDNAKTYWDAVGCSFLFGKVNTYWYILQDAVPTLPSPSFGLVGAGSVSQAPLFDLTCPAISSSASASASAGAAGIAGIANAAGSSSSSSSSTSAISSRPVVATSSASAAAAAGGRSTSARPSVVTTSSSPPHSAAASSSSTVRPRSSSTGTAAQAAAAGTTTTPSSTPSTTAAATSATRSTSAATELKALSLGLLGLLAFFMTL